MGNVTANVTVSTNGESLMYTIPIRPARGSNDTRTHRVSLAIPDLDSGDILAVEARPSDPSTLDAAITDNRARTQVRNVGEGSETNATTLSIASATAQPTDMVVVNVTLVNDGRVTTVEIVTLRQEGEVLAREAVAVRPGTRTVTISTDASDGSLEIETVSDSESVSVSMSDAVARADQNGDGAITTIELVAAIQTWNDG